MHRAHFTAGYTVFLTSDLRIISGLFWLFIRLCDRQVGYADRMMHSNSVILFWNRKK